ncbi:peptidase S41 [Chitinophaga sp. SYP-B3965]|uniref:S41 family peptidase n=1 Tax=Chitinophaga sp. SYP-B3965 TaxID=2663120 RepID=UPI001299933A|nr:S41 family peptidase [Chitinophaga sp. SYP-B3965]MRG46116.1 peptidase S41 [Chitinophaga sp. SYP-B3965]
MKRVLPILCLILLCHIVSAADVPSWLRYPAISPDGKTIVFSWRGDLYKVPTAGGSAIQLTSDTTYECMPVWSKDGKSIVFAGNSFGNFDLFIIPATGGKAKRLTWHSADEYPYDLVNDKVIFGAVRLDDPENRQFPSDALQELYEVPMQGGPVTQILTTPAEDAKVSSTGRYIIYHDRKGRENIWRKHQVSSIARDIWLYDTQTGSHKKITSFAGEDRSPVWAGEGNIYYLSEQSGSFNVFTTDLKNNVQQVTFFKEHPLRSLSISQNGTLCFSYNGDIYQQQKDKKPVKINIRIAAPVKNRDEINVPIADISELAISPFGKELAFISRGHIFTGSTTGKSFRSYVSGGTSVSFSPDGKDLLFASFVEGKWRITSSSTTIANEHDNYQPVYSPDGKEIAFIEDRTTLKIFNIANHTFRTILGPDQLTSRRDHDQYFEWSPDGKWLLVKFNEQGAGNDEVGMISTSGEGKLINLTKSGYSDTNPHWALEGKMIVWFTDRHGLHSYANSSTRQQDVYALYFDKDTTTKRERLTNYPSLLASALVNRNGDMLYYLSKLGKNYDLWSCNLRTKETKLLLPLNIEETTMEWDKEKQFIYMLADGKILRVDPVAGKKENIEFKGSFPVNIKEERKVMFEYVWNKTKQTFYTAGMHGVNWEALKVNYEKFLPHINNNYDFAEMLNELLGELNVSHTGATYDRRDGDVTASLGVFYNQQYKGPGVEIKEIMKGSPLEGLVKAGAVIEAIDGEKIMPDKDFAAYLNRKAGKKIALTIDKQQITIQPITPAAETDLLIERWAQRNEADVDKQSNGTLGYVHLYRMNDNAYRHTYEEVLGKYPGRKGIIVDTRFNRGGDLASELIMFLSGRRVRDNTTDHFLLNSEPSFRWTKPSIVLACEANYSDGQCFVHDYQVLKMGKLVGMPVPGSCTWMTGQTLVDNTMHFSVPTVGVKDLQGKYLENVSTQPDITVMNEFDKVARGQDQQLEAAIRELIKDIK